MDERDRLIATATTTCLVVDGNKEEPDEGARPKVDLLRRLPSLAAVRRRDLASVAPLVEDLCVRAGVVVVPRATCATRWCWCSRAPPVSVGGRVVGVVGPGDVLGDLAVREHLPHATTVTATTNLHVLVAVPKSPHLRAPPVVVRHVKTATLSDRLRRADTGA